MQICRVDDLPQYLISPFSSNRGLQKGGNVRKKASFSGNRHERIVEQMLGGYDRRDSAGTERCMGQNGCQVRHDLLILLDDLKICRFSLAITFKQNWKHVYSSPRTCEIFDEISLRASTSCPRQNARTSLYAQRSRRYVISSRVEKPGGNHPP